jgi:predicted metal-dependent hydrolase
MKVIIVIIILAIIYMYLDKNSNEVIFVESALNNKRYLVRNLPDKQEAADLLAEISIKLESIIQHLKENSCEEVFYKFKIRKPKKKDDKDDHTDAKKQLEDNIKRLINNFNPDNFSESTPDVKYTSYSVNKGEKIVFCLRSKKAEQQLVKKNTMMFVAIHELSHLMTESVGHEPEFWDNFKFLLLVAIHIKAYKHINFNKNPEEYCGTEITDTPLKHI